MFAVLHLYMVCLLAVPTFTITVRPTANNSLPLVDLGYTIHQASLNDTGNYYNFSNIRYASPPLGALRFAAPKPPQGRNRTIESGSTARICPQAYPVGVFANALYGLYYSQTGQTDVGGFLNATAGLELPSLTPPDPRMTEDCLFLDVMVPRKVFDKRSSKGKGRKKGAAVLVWIHGGGFGAGSKYDVPPAGLLSRSQIGGEEGVIFVAINYRLGALGWLSGPSFAVDGLPNAGFYDQRLALKWVRDNIYRFGGDPERVTVFGQSSGGGSIAFQLTAYGGRKEKAPFQQAIMQSPGFTPPTGKFEQEQNFRTFLQLLNVSSLEQARELPTEALQAANDIQIRNSRAGSWTFGPVIDGTFVTDLPGVSLLQGNFDSSVNIMVGHNGNEGFGFPSVFNDTAFDDYISTIFPNAAAAAQDYITTTLYPPQLPTTEDLPTSYSPLNSTSIVVTGYDDQPGRQAFLTSEVVINCLVNHLNLAFASSKHASYSYLFSAPPALHGQELNYVFYNGQGQDTYTRPIDVGLAHTVQDYWLNFALRGSPNGVALPSWETWGDERKVLGLSLAGVGMRSDPVDGGRCRWWQLGVYL